MNDDEIGSSLKSNHQGHVKFAHFLDTHIIAKIPDTQGVNGNTYSSFIQLPKGKTLWKLFIFKLIGEEIGWDKL